MDAVPIDRRWLSRCWPRAGRVTAVIGWLVAGALLGGCGLPGPLARTPVETQMIATDNGLLKASVSAPGSPGRTALTSEEALARAAATISRTEQARGVRAREALLTLESETGQVVTQSRHTWLVTYDGRTFEAEQGCSCYHQTWANTTVVLDAQSGQVVLVFGTDQL